MNFHHHSLVLEVVSRLHTHGSWTGKTHVQKAVFLLQSRCVLQQKTDFNEIDLEIENIPFKFVLYHHGPYSFDLERTIEEMSSYKALTIEPMNGYGVALWCGNNSSFLQENAPLSQEEKDEIELVCRFVGSSDVKTLERWATAAWIRHREGVCETHEVAERLHQVKPHVGIVEGEQADKTISLLFTSRIELGNLQAKR